MSQDEQFAVITFSSGLICLYDVRNSYNYLGDIEKDAQRFSFASQNFVQARILEAKDQHRDPLLSRQQDIGPSLAHTLDALNEHSGTSVLKSQLKVITSTSPNCLRLQVIEVKGNKTITTPVVQYVIDEGRITGFDVHPSKDYLLVTSSKGKAYIFRIETGELRGTIKLPLHAQGCSIDPSGLYFLVQVPPFNSSTSRNLINSELNVYNGESVEEHFGS